MASLVDRARQCHAEASSSKSAERAAAFAVDGNSTTRWTSSYADNQWLAVDLGEICSLVRVEIRWEKACAATYLIQVSPDGKDWTTLKSESGREGWVSTPLPPSCKARWVRIYGQRRATQFGFSIHELKVLCSEEAAAREESSASKDAVAQKDSLERLPGNVGTDLKWYLWNAVWQAANSTCAAIGPVEKREQKLHRAHEDGQRSEEHYRAALATGTLCSETLQRLRHRADLAGQAAAAAALHGGAMGEAALEPPPVQLRQELWASSERAIRLAGATVAAMIRNEAVPEPPPPTPELGARWIVVGGAEQGGLVVREGRDWGSKQVPERLALGATLRELELAEQQLHFTKVTGRGPPTGWIHTRAGERPLAERLATDAAAVAARRSRWREGRALQAEFESQWQQLFAQSGTPPPLPPRPLTAEWLYREEQLWEEPLQREEQLREESLPAELDEGMASVCTLLQVGKERFVVKRAASAPDLRVLRCEHRFYVELASQLSAVHVPALLASYWGPEGWEAEGFLLVMECLAEPHWVRVAPEDGCSADQALAAVSALGRLHAAFSGSAAPWLPLTPLDLKSGDGGLQGQYVSCLIRASSFLKALLPPGAMGACVAMCLGGLPRMLGRMASPPLTLLHGDFRTENLRFSCKDPSVVAAFDWGMVSRGRGALDLAYFLALGVAPEQRRAVEKKLVDRYLTAVSGLSAAQLWRDLRASALCLLGKLVLAYADFFGPQRTQDMLERSLRWAGAAVEDWEAFRELDE